jgi:hypothetical protein
MDRFGGKLVFLVLMKAIDSFQTFLRVHCEMAKSRSSFTKRGAFLNLLCTLLFLVGAAGGALAQTGGEIIWSVDLAHAARTAAPRVAPSGDIYIHSDGWQPALVRFVQPRLAGDRFA